MRRVRPPRRCGYPVLERVAAFYVALQALGLLVRYAVYLLAFLVGLLEGFAR